MSQPDRSPRPARPARARLARTAALGLAFALGAAGCSGVSGTTADSLGGHSTDPGCIAALKAVSTYGPRAVEGLASGRETVNKAIVHLLVLALDAAADSADQPSDKQAISTLANVYEDYYVLKTNVVAIPAADLLRDTTDLDSVCKS